MSALTRSGGQPSAALRDSAERLHGLTRLADAKNAQVSAGQLETYVGLLSDVPTPLLLACCVRLARAQTFGFPPVAEILAMADDIQREAKPPVRALPPMAADEDRRRWVHCQECRDDDGAWVTRWCPGARELRDDVMPDNALARSGGRMASCGRESNHAPHSYADRCSCHLAPWREERRRNITKYSEDRRDRKAS